MSRLRGLRPDELTEDQRAVYDSIAGGDRARDASFKLTEADGSLVGPFNALLYNPGLGDALQRLGAALRFHSGFSPKLKEAVILAVAARWRSVFEWWAHEPIGRRAGLDDAQIAALHAGETPEFDDPDTAAAFAFARLLIEGTKTNDEAFAEAQSALGDSGVLEMVALVGYYTMLAQLMDTLEVDVPEGEESAF